MDAARERHRPSNGDRDNEAGPRLLTQAMAISGSDEATADSDRRRSRRGGEVISVVGLPRDQELLPVSVPVEGVRAGELIGVRFRLTRTAAAHMLARP